LCWCVCVFGVWCVFVCLCWCVCVCVCVRWPRARFLCKNTSHLCVCVCVSVRLYLCVCALLRVCVITYEYACTYMHTCACTCMCVSCVFLSLCMSLYMWKRVFDQNKKKYLEQPCDPAARKCIIVRFCEYFKGHESHFVLLLTVVLPSVPSLACCAILPSGPYLVHKFLTSSWLL